MASGREGRGGADATRNARGAGADAPTPQHLPQAQGVGAALARSASSRAVNTSFVERQNGTDRNRNARKVRKSYCFSKDWSVHQAITFFTMYSYNFCWPVRTLRIKSGAGDWQRRTPAMAAGLADHVWPPSEWLTLPAVHQK